MTGVTGVETAETGAGAAALIVRVVATGQSAVTAPSVAAIVRNAATAPNAETASSVAAIVRNGATGPSVAATASIGNEKLVRDRVTAPAAAGLDVVGVPT